MTAQLETRLWSCLMEDTGLNIYKVFLVRAFISYLTFHPL